MKRKKVHKYIVALMTVMNMWYMQAAAQQNFHYKAALDTVQQSGFYKIMLTPAIVAQCQPHLEDIRVKDNKGSDIPYIVKQQTTASVATNIIIFPLIRTSNLSSVILQNNSGTGTDEITLFIKNTAAYRNAILSGSDDTSHWFVIKENIVLAKDNSAADTTSFSQTISFPYSNYRYFRISMQGKDSLPLNIFKAGTYRTRSILNSSYDAVPQPAMVQHDSSDKRSYILLQFDKYYRIDKLQCTFGGAKFFNRSFTLYDGNNANNAVLSSGNITSHDSSITLNVQAKTNALLLVVNNLDNVPLHVSKMTAFQLPINLITYLNAGKQYSLLYGDSTLQAPAYDLQYFSDSIGANITTLTVKNIRSIAAPTGAKANDNNHLNTWILWSIIIAVLLLLIYFSFTLLKDINRKNTNTDAHL